MINGHNHDTDRILRRMNEIYYEQTCTSYRSLGIAIIGIAITLIIYGISVLQSPGAFIIIFWAIILFFIGAYIFLLDRYIACLTLTKRLIPFIGLLALKTWPFFYCSSFGILIPAFISLSNGTVLGMDCSKYIIIFTTILLLSVFGIILSQYWDGEENADPEQVIIGEMMQ
jgi:hypothetical protein